MDNIRSTTLSMSFYFNGIEASRTRLAKVKRLIKPCWLPIKHTLTALLRVRRGIRKRQVVIDLVGH